jgi:anti-sigma regulatory factor (Ser/Thr protein kinase)
MSSVATAKGPIGSVLRSPDQHNLPLRHQALLYGTRAEFVDATLPFVREGAEKGEPVLVAVRERNIDALRDALNGEAGGADVTLHSIAEWYENPSRTRTKFAQWADSRAGGGRIRLVGEPPWPLASEAGVREWARHESVINVALADLPVTFICPYNRSELPPEVLEHARATHPEILEGGRTVGSDTYQDPDEFCRRFAGPTRRRPGSPSAEMEIERWRLGELRRLVELEASAAGMPEHRIADLVVAVNELATNALVHGVGPAWLRAWQERDELVLEVTDAGSGIADPLAGQLLPDPAAIGGFGLWIVRMTADATEVLTDMDGTTVIIHSTLAG